jgi:hypothetical protein
LPPHPGQERRWRAATCAALKARPGGDLIDDLHLFVNPVAIGQGLPIFGRGGRSDLTLVAA